ncbi:MAG: transposase [Tannerella sp.]|jgi:phosphate uptake regulator|nr:transposase [Tannerella sp.]
MLSQSLSRYDRFHVQMSAHDVLQEMRIAHRRNAVNQETEAREQARSVAKKYIPKRLENSDSCRQLLAGSRCLLFKSPDKRTDKQKQRARLSFGLYSDIKKSAFKSFNTMAATVYEHYDKILNFFIKRSTGRSRRIFQRQNKGFLSFDRRNFRYEILPL